MTGRPCFRCQGTLSLVFAVLMLHGAVSVSVGQDAPPVDEEQHQIEVAAAGSMLHGSTQVAGDEASLQSPMVPRRRLVRAVEDMGPPGASRPSLMQMHNVPDGTVIPDQYTSSQFNFDPYKDGPSSVIGDPGPPGHEGMEGHQGTIGNTGSEGAPGSPGHEGHEGPHGKPGHMFHLHGYATRSEVMKVFMLNFTVTLVAFLFLMKKLKEKYGPGAHHTGLEFHLTIAGINFGKLSGHQSVWHNIEETLQGCLSSQVGASKSEIHITLSDGGSSLKAEVWIDTDHEKASEMGCALPHLSDPIMKSVSDQLAQISGMGDVQTDTVSCTSVSPPVVH